MYDHLNVVSLPGKNPSVPLRVLHNSAYAMWKAVWSETFAELDGSTTLHSDDFTRQDEILCIFKGQTCLALVCIRHMDFSMNAAADDSYFKVWSEQARQGLLSHGQQILVCSYLTVHPLGRGRQLGLPLKDVMVGLIVRRFLQTQTHAMTGTMRVDRGAHKTTFQFGAQLLSPRLTHHTVPVDLVAFFSEKITTSSDPDVALAVETLWQRFLNSSQSMPQRKAG